MTQPVRIIPLIHKPQPLQVLVVVITTVVEIIMEEVIQYVLSAVEIELCPRVMVQTGFHVLTVVEQDMYEI